ncbi:MAG: hypothetical protein NZM43_08265 [Saprospiraceae bacterium]|nr:hypothetical protein [Saprospiraceae bacterium]MDW8484303.1 hypothetical protein [Saprospiraceae bacterium]
MGGGALLVPHAGQRVIIDEVRQMPALLPLLRWLTDQRREPARFVLTGSAFTRPAQRRHGDVGRAHRLLRINAFFPTGDKPHGRSARALIARRIP